MRKKIEVPTTTAATSIDTLEAEIANLLREIDNERRSLRPLIMRGDNTAPTRQRIAALEAKLAGARARIDQLAATRSARLADDAAQDTADIAGRLATALAAKLAALEPPTQPSK
jgi:uncharacterized coiled-coil protein SlyX